MPHPRATCAGQRPPRRPPVPSFTGRCVLCAALFALGITRVAASRLRSRLRASRLRLGFLLPLLSSSTRPLARSPASSSLFRSYASCTRRVRPNRRYASSGTTIRPHSRSEEVSKRKKGAERKGEESGERGRPAAALTRPGQPTRPSGDGSPLLHRGVRRRGAARGGTGRPPPLPWTARARGSP